MVFVMINCSPDSSQETSITFKGVIHFDENGSPIGGDFDDDGDWQIGDIWIDEEEELFDSELQMINCDVNETYFCSPFPNPCTDVLNLFIGQPDGSTIDLRFVDEDLNIVIEFDDLISNTLSIQTANLAKDTFRIYYRFQHDDCEFRGHGDILVE